MFCDPPSPDTLEISVFGSGIGESIVVHLTENRWLVVDSFLTRDETPVALAYLEGIHATPDRIDRVVVSHWHDDHIKGISEVYEQAVNAKVVISPAVSGGELRQLIGADSGKLKSASATEELSRIIQLIHERGGGKNRIADFDLASDNKPLYVNDGKFETKIWSLSPSAASILYALRKIKKYLPSQGDEPPCRPPQNIENDSSIVLLLKVGSIAALLGADLETEADSNIGWRAIVHSQERPQIKASFFKIPHHGSKTGYEPLVWHEMLENQPWSVLTPMRSSKLPTKEGIAMICQHTDKLWTAAPLTPPPKIKRPRVVEKQMKLCTRRRWVQEGPVGQVRFRVNLLDSNQTPIVDCDPPATQL